MPYIGSRVVDSAGIALIEQWIRELPHVGDAGRLRTVAGRSDDAIRDLLASTEGALALAAQMHRGALDRQTHTAAVAAGMAASSDVRGLFEAFVPESKRRKTLDATVDPQVVLDQQGDRERGKLIFFSDAARCKNCHEIDDRGKSLGPTLLDIVKKFPRPAELIQHAMQPSLKIDEPFAAYTVVTDDGRVVIGLVVEQSQQEVVIKTLERQVVRLARKDIEEMRKSDRSLMPERILSDLTAQEAADLFAYIRSMQAEPSSR
jgi:putative heme-binding domain-containing protein